MIYGIRNRGNTCYAAAVIQCICRILHCIPTDIIDLDKIPRVASDAQEFYEMIVSKIPILRHMVSAIVSDTVVPCILWSQLEEVREIGEVVCIRVDIQESIDNIRYMSIRGRKYRLLACVLLNNAHYRAIVENNNNWFVCDDDNISVSDTTKNVHLYLLFYKYIPRSNV